MSLRTKNVRFLFLVMACCYLSACGFKPVYGTGRDSANQSVDLPTIKVESTGNRVAQMYRIALEDRLNPSGATHSPVYLLKTEVSYSQGATDVARDGTIQRSNVNFTSQYSLVRADDGTVVSVGNVRNVSSYSNQVGAYYSTYVSEQDAIKRGVEELSERMRQRIIAYVTGPYAGRPDPSVGKIVNTEPKDEFNPAAGSGFISPNQPGLNNLPPTYNPYIP